MRALIFPAILVVAIIGLVTVLQAQDKPATTGKKATTVQSSAVAQYSCPMHPEATSDKAGKCTKCGMDMTKKKADGAAQTSKMHSKKDMKKGCCSQPCSEPCEEK